MMSLDAAIVELLLRRQAAADFLLFIKYTKQDFIINWHHRVLAAKLQDFAEGKIKKLMIFLQPQVGKSEMSTRRLPSYILGKDPTKRIAVAAYNQTFASRFNRDIQRIIDDQPYKNVFPDTRLNNNDGYARNSEEFEIVNHTGFLKTVGVGGPLTGTSVDIGIIDDPIKDAMEAYSSTFRDRIWDWYNSVFLTRLHNDSQQLITLTRWHEDDLAGRILKAEDDWEVLIFPAIKEDYTNELDTRELGEALWPERHSLARMQAIAKKNPLIWASLYQQHPYYNAEEGRFAWAFARDKHVGHCQWNPRHNTFLSFDFNRNPICCTIFQHYNDTIYVLRCIKLKNSDIYKLLAEVKRIYPNAVFIVTGDATGKHSNALVKDNINYYTVIRKTLNLSKAAIKVNAVNPSLAENQVLLNALLQHYKWVIEEENAAAVIFDMEYVKMLPDGTIDKSNRTDPTKQADALDTVRYFCDKFFRWFLSTDPTQEVEQPDNQITTINKNIHTISVAQKAVAAVGRGETVTCTSVEYQQTVRNAILESAGKWLDGGDNVRAQIALMEVKRLDTFYQ